MMSVRNDRKPWQEENLWNLFWVYGFFAWTLWYTVTTACTATTILYGTHDLHNTLTIALPLGLVKIGVACCPIYWGLAIRRRTAHSDNAWRYMARGFASGTCILFGIIILYSSWHLMNFFIQYRGVMDACPLSAYEYAGECLGARF